MRVFVKRENHSVPRICRHATDANILSHPPIAIRMYANVCLYECVIVRVCMMQAHVRVFPCRAFMRAPVCRLWAVDGGPDGELTVSEQMLQSQVCTARSTAVTAVRTPVPNCS